MAISTTLTRNEFNRRLYGTANLRVASVTGITINSTPLTIAGDTVVMPVQVLPSNTYQCKITGMPRGKGRIIFKVGDTVTG